MHPSSPWVEWDPTQPGSLKPSLRPGRRKRLLKHAVRESSSIASLNSNYQLHMNKRPVLGSGTFALNG